MDALDKEIDSLRREREQCRARLQELDIVLPVLERAAALRPTSARNDRPTEQQDVAPRSPRIRTRKKAGGRKPGAISKEWQEILKHVYQDGKPLTYEEISEYANLLGNNLQISSVRDRVRNLLRTGLLSGSPESGFVVTKDAVERFGFTKENGESADSSEAKAEEARTLFGPLNPNPAQNGA